MGVCSGPRQCIGRALARIIHDASVAQLVSHFRFQLAERMGGPEGVDRHEINRLTMQPGQGESTCPFVLHCRSTAKSLASPEIPSCSELSNAQGRAGKADCEWHIHMCRHVDVFPVPCTAHGARQAH